jgi:hypothetical protein
VKRDHRNDLANLRRLVWAAFVEAKSNEEKAFRKDSAVYLYGYRAERQAYSKVLDLIDEATKGD